MISEREINSFLKQQFKLIITKTVEMSLEKSNPLEITLVILLLTTKPRSFNNTYEIFFFKTYSIKSIREIYAWELLI